MPKPTQAGAVRRAAAAAALATLAAGGAAAADPDMATILSAVVGVRAEIAASARTAATLGTERTGSGVVIDGGGLVLTIGYLILEAERVHVAPLGGDGPEVEAQVVAYDHDTGFGLVRASAPLGVRPMPIGESRVVPIGSPVIVASFGGPDAARAALLVDRREFAGYWEYLIEDALYASPPHPLFGGAALVDASGALIGIGSLVVDDAGGPGSALVGNLFVPVDLLKPILADLLTTGRGPRPHRPWIGMQTQEHGGRLLVRRVAEGSPAARAGVRVGAIVVAVGGRIVGGLAEMYRAMWSSAAPGGVVTLSLLEPDGSVRDVDVEAIDRYEWIANAPRGSTR